MLWHDKDPSLLKQIFGDFNQDLTVNLVEDSTVQPILFLVEQGLKVADPGFIISENPSQHIWVIVNGEKGCYRPRLSLEMKPRVNLFEPLLQQEKYGF